MTTLQRKPQQRTVLAILFWQLLCCVLFCLPGQALALDVPLLSARVNDLAGRLEPATVQTLEQSLRQLEEEDSTQIAVLVIDSLEGEALEDFSLKVATTWGLGQKGKDNGALLLVALEDRAVRIEVGYGLEDRLTDLVCGRIIRNEIVPAFREGDFDQGVTAGIAAMTQAVRGAYQATDSASEPEPFALTEALIFFGLFGWLCAQLVGANMVLTATVGGLAALSFGLWLEEAPLACLAGGATGGALASYVSLITCYFPNARITPLNRPFYVFLACLLFLLDCLKHPLSGSGSRSSGGGGGGFGGGGASGRW